MFTSLVVSELVGVLEPLQAAPVIIEDDAFIGSRCIVVEGVRVEKEAVLGANVVLTGSTKIIDVTGPEPIELKGVVPSRSVVIPGSYTKTFPAGDFNVPCALIIGKRKESTNKKTSLNDALRTHNVAGINKSKIILFFHGNFLILIFKNLNEVNSKYKIIYAFKYLGLCMVN
jgi:hypothetical protein